MRHPKIIHRVWLGSNEPLRRDVEFTRRWQELHPGWSMVVWDDEEVEQHLQPLILDHLYQQAPTYVHRADLVAIEAVYQYGGIQVGWDLEPVRNVESLIENSDGWCTPDADNYPGGAFFGARESHPALKALLTVIADLVSDRGWTHPNRDTGPYVWNAALGSYGMMPNGLDVLGTSKTAYPVHWRDKHRLRDPQVLEQLRTDPEVYAIHHFNGSWLPGGLDVRVR